MTSRLSVLALLACVACASAATPRAPQFITNSASATRPFSAAVRANGFLILAGQIGTDSTGGVVKGGIQAETRQTMNNIKAELERNGSSMEKVVKCTVFMAD